MVISIDLRNFLLVAGVFGALCICTMVMAADDFWWNFNESIICGNQLFADFDPRYISLLALLNRLLEDAVNMHPIGRTIITSHNGKVASIGQASCLPLQLVDHEGVFMSKESCRACLNYCREKVLRQCGKRRVASIETNGCNLSYNYNGDGPEDLKDACPIEPEE